MPSSVTDFLHHVHAEKSKSTIKNKYPSNGGGNGNGEEEEQSDGEEDDIGDRDNEHELYLLHQHQQQLSEKLTAQLLRQQQQKYNNRLASNRRNSDGQPVESSGINPWERRNKRTYHDENLLMDYIIDMPVGENSENWNLVTNDDLGEDDPLITRLILFSFFLSAVSGWRMK